MLSLSSESRIYLYLQAVDLRKGFEGLGALTQSMFPQKLFTGAYFAFLNKASNKIKVLYWDVDGLVIWCKRLEKGTFKKIEKDELNRRDFFMLLEGITPQKTSHRFIAKIN